MRRQRTGFWVLGAAMVAAAAMFAACGSSSSSTKTPASSGNTPTQPSGGAATETSGAATESSGSAPTESSGAAPTAAATTGGSASSGGLPADACTLLTNQEASAIANGTITGNTDNTTKALFAGGTTAPCGYYGDGTGDHPVELFVTEFGDAGTAEKLMQNRAKLGQTLHTYTSIANVGDEAFAYNVGQVDSVLIRRGSLVLELDAGSSDDPAAAISAVEAAAKTAFGRL